MCSLLLNRDSCGKSNIFCSMWFLISRSDLADWNWEPSGLNLGFLFCFDFWVLLWSLFLGCSFTVQAYTSELEYLVHQLEQENARLINEEVRV